MKNLLLISLISGIFILGACKNHKADTAATEVKKENMAPEDTIKMLNLSFFSIGEGVDFEAVKNFKMYLEDSALNEKLELEEFAWGREGEIDFCMNLQNLATEEKSSLLLKANEIKQSSKLVHLEYNLPCRNKRQ